MSRPAERRPRGFVSRSMGNVYALLALAAGLIVAIFAGVNLGNATVEGINPIHLQPRTPPRLRTPVMDEASPAPLARRLPNYSELYGWDEGQAAIAADCGAGCSDDGLYSAEIPYFGSREELQAEEMRARRAIDSAFAEETRDSLVREKERPARDDSPSLSVRSVTVDRGMTAVPAETVEIIVDQE